jgi:hypothetical protein
MSQIAGSLEIEMFSNIARITADMAAAKGVVTSAMAGVESAVASAKSALASLGMGLGVGYFVSLIKGSIDAQAHLEDLTKSTSLTAKELAGLSLIAAESGTNLDSIAKAFDRMSVAIGKNPEKFVELGITAETNTGKFKQLADVFNSLTDVNQRNALAQAIFKKSWDELAPALALGGEGLQALFDKSAALNPNIEENAKQAQVFKNNLAELTAAMDASKNKMVGDMLPAFTQITQAITLAYTESGKLQAIWVALGAIGAFAFTDTFSSNTAKLKDLQAQLDSLIAKRAAIDVNTNPFGFIGKLIYGGDPALYDKRIVDTQAQIAALQAQMNAPVKSGTVIDPAVAAANAAAAAEFLKATKDAASALAEVYTGEQKLLDIQTKGQVAAIEGQTKLGTITQEQADIRKMALQMEQNLQQQMFVQEQLQQAGLTDVQKVKLQYKLQELQAESQSIAAAAGLKIQIDAQNEALKVQAEYYKATDAYIKQMAAEQDKQDKQVIDYNASVKQQLDDVTFHLSIMGQTKGVQEQLTALHKFDLDYATATKGLDEDHLAAMQAQHDSDRQAIADGALLLRNKQDQADATRLVIEADKRIVNQIDGEFRNAFMGLWNSTSKDWEVMLTSMKASFLKILGESLYTFFAKPFVLNIVASVAGIAGATGVQAAANNALGVSNAANGGIGIGNLLSGANSLGSIFGGPSLTTAFTNFGTGLSTYSTMLGEGATTMEATTAATAGLGASFATLIPYVGLAILAYELLASGKTTVQGSGAVQVTPGGAPIPITGQLSGGYDPTAVMNAAMAGVTQFTNIVTQLGGKISNIFTLGIGQGGGGEFNVTTGIGSSNIIDKAGLDSTQMQLEATRAILVGLQQAADFPNYIKSIFAAINASTATSQQITDAIAFANTLKTLHDNLEEARSPFKILSDSVTEMQITLGTGIITSAADFNAKFLAAINADMTPETLANWQKLATLIDNVNAAIANATSQKASLLGQFQSPAEKLAGANTAVTAQFGSTGQSFEWFANFIKDVDPATEAGQKMLATLTLLAPSMQLVAANTAATTDPMAIAAENERKMAVYMGQANSLNIQLLNLEGRGAEAQKYQLMLDVDAINANKDLTEAQKASLIETRNEIDAQETLATTAAAAAKALADWNSYNDSYLTGQVQLLRLKGDNTRADQLELQMKIAAIEANKNLTDAQKRSLETDQYEIFTLQQEAKAKADLAAYTSAQNNLDLQLLQVTGDTIGANKLKLQLDIDAINASTTYTDAQKAALVITRQLIDAQTQQNAANSKANTFSEATQSNLAQIFRLQGRNLDANAQDLASKEAIINATYGVGSADAIYLNGQLEEIDRLTRLNDATKIQNSLWDQFATSQQKYDKSVTDMNALFAQFGYTVPQTSDAFVAFLATLDPNSTSVQAFLAGLQLMGNEVGTFFTGKPGGAGNNMYVESPPAAAAATSTLVDAATYAATYNALLVQQYKLQDQNSHAIYLSNQMQIEAIQNSTQYTDAQKKQLITETQTIQALQAEADAKAKLLAYNQSYNSLMVQELTLKGDTAGATALSNQMAIDAINQSTTLTDVQKAALVTETQTVQQLQAETDAKNKLIAYNNTYNGMLVQQYQLQNNSADATALSNQMAIDAINQSTQYTDAQKAQLVTETQLVQQLQAEDTAKKNLLAYNTTYNNLLIQQYQLQNNSAAAVAISNQAAIDAINASTTYTQAQKDALIAQTELVQGLQAQAEAARKLKVYTDQYTAGQIALAQASGDSATVLALQRQQTLDAIQANKDLTDAQKASLTTQQKQIFVQQDMQTAATKATDAMKALSAQMDQVAAFKDSVGKNIFAVQSAQSGFDATAYYAAQVSTYQGQLGKATTVQDQLALGAKLNDSIMGRYNAEMAAVQKQQQAEATAQQAAIQAANQLNAAYRQIGDYARSLLLSTLTPLDPKQQLAEAKKQYDTTYAAARAGDLTALGQLSGVANTYLTQDRAYGASSGSTVADFNRVQGQLTALGAKAGPDQVYAENTAKWQAQDAIIQQKALDDLTTLSKQTDTWQATLQSQMNAQAEIFNGIGLSLTQISANTKDLPERVVAAINDNNKARDRTSNLLAQQMTTATISAAQDTTAAVKQLPTAMASTSNVTQRR